MKTSNVASQGSHGFIFSFLEPAVELSIGSVVFNIWVQDYLSRDYNYKSLNRCWYKLMV